MPISEPGLPRLHRGRKAYRNTLSTGSLPVLYETKKKHVAAADSKSSRQGKRQCTRVEIPYRRVRPWHAVACAAVGNGYGERRRGFPHQPRHIDGSGQFDTHTYRGREHRPAVVLPYRAPSHCRHRGSPRIHRLQCRDGITFQYGHCGRIGLRQLHPLAGGRLCRHRKRDCRQQYGEYEECQDPLHREILLR